MKQILIISFLIISFSCTGQNYTKAEFKELYTKTVNTIKNNDTIGFIKLWQYSDTMLQLKGEHIVNFHVIDLKKHFIEISNNWTPYLNRMSYYYLDMDKMTKKERTDLGQSAAYVLTLDNDKNKIIGIGVNAIYYKGQLVYREGSFLSTITTK